MNYNPSQKQAIESPAIYNRIIAGAGTGKTQIVSGRIKYLIENLKVPYDQICAITFSKNAANEILDRTTKIVGHKLPGISITTFNALENEIALDNWEKFGYKHRMSVIDDVQDLPMCDALLRRHPIYEWTGVSFSNYIPSKEFRGSSALQIVSVILHKCAKLKTVMDFNKICYADVALELLEIKATPPPFVIEKIIAMYPEYENMKKGLDPEFTSSVITFDEQVALATKIINDDPSYLDEHYNFSHIIVDEAQDTSIDQIKFLQHLINMKKFKSLTVVGDDSQCIYESLMNTSPDYLINLNKYLCKVDSQNRNTPINIQDTVLNINYRCVGEIINLANLIIDKNTNKIKKTLIASRENGNIPTVMGFCRKHDEKPKKTNKDKKIEIGQYDQIARDIEVAIHNGASPDDIAFLAFSKNELKIMADKLTDKNIPSKFGAPEFLLENHRVKAMLKFIVSTRINSNVLTIDMLDIANVLLDGDLMDKNIDFIKATLEDIKNRLNSIHAELSYTQKKELINAFIDDISHGDEAVKSFKEKFKEMDYDEIVTYCDNFDVFGGNMLFKRSVLGEGVMLITVHSAKGLEWKHVYGSLTGFHQKGMNQRKMEEMRRLLFVLITRARDYLHLYGLFISYKDTYGKNIANMYLEECYNALNVPYNPCLSKIK